MSHEGECRERKEKGEMQMKIDKEEIISLDEPEKKETQKKKGGGVVLKVFGVLALCALLMGAEAFYFLRFYEPADKITGEEKESGNGENEVPVLSDSVVYSQEELDATMEELNAAANATGEIPNCSARLVEASAWEVLPVTARSAMSKPETSATPV